VLSSVDSHYLMYGAIFCWWKRNLAVDYCLIFYYNTGIYSPWQ